MKPPAGSRSKRLLAMVPLALLALAAGAWLAQSRYAPQSPAPTSIDGLWAISFPDTRGHPQALSQWRGQIVVLNFWASWCAPCREEMPDFVDLRSKYQSKGVEFVGIAIDNSANVSQFLKQISVNYPILIGEGAAHSLARQLGNPSGALPYTIVIDRNGNVVLKHLGRLPHDTLENTLRQIST